MTEVSKNFEFPITFQRSLLSCIFKDKNFYHKAVKIINPSNFDSTSLQYICRKIINGSSTLSILLEEIKNDKNTGKINADLKKAVLDEMKLICKESDFDEAQYSLDKLKEFVIRQNFDTGILGIVKVLKETGDIKSAIKQVKKLAIIDDDNEFIKTIDFISDKDERFKERQDKVDKGEVVFIPTGIIELDNDIKGPRLGQFWTIFGDTNIGKSALMAGISTHTAIKGYHTWHIVIEDELDMTLQRFDTAFSRVEFDKLTYCNYTDEEKIKIDKIFDLLKSRRNKYLYITKVEEGFTMEAIEEEYDRLKNVEGFNPKVITIDSPYNMEPILKRDSYRLNCAQIYREIRKFARKYKVAVLTSDQTKQEMKGRKADTDASSETYDKARIADGFITLNQTRIQRKEGIIELWIAKMKDRKKHISYYLKPNIGIMRFESIKMEDNNE